MTETLIIIFLCMLFSFFFSGMEIAFYRANLLRIELAKSQGSTGARLISAFINHPSRFITNSLIGNNIVNVIYGIACSKLFQTLFFESGVSFLQSGIISFILITIISSVNLLVFCEFFPKAIFIINPNKILTYLIYLFQIIYYLLLPFSFLLSNTSRIILRLTGMKQEDKEHSFDYYDLFDLLTEETHKSDDISDMEFDTQILKNAIELPTVKARDCMVPRTEIEALDIEDSIEKLKNTFIESGHSKIVIYQENIDQVVGYVHQADLFDNPSSIKNILRNIPIITESMPANKMLKQFTGSNTHIALVVDEYGGTAGIVTTEDVLEEIFGEIEDEYDSEDLREIKVRDNEYILSARLEIDYLNDKYHFHLPEGEYKTLGGLILDVSESIPARNSVIKLGHFTLKVLSVSESKLGDILLQIIPSESESR